MENEILTNIPDVEDKDLAAVVETMPKLPLVRGAPADRFARAVRTLVEKRAQHHWPNENEANVAVFVLVGYPRKVGRVHGATSFTDPMAKLSPLLGHLFFSNTDVSRGQCIPLPVTPDEILDWLEDNDLCGCPIVTVYRDTQKMVTRHSGTKHLARTDEIRDEEPTATMTELIEALKYYHKRRLLIPKICPKGVWKKGVAAKYIPGPQPEKSIQSDLECALNFWFRDVVLAESEDSTGIGRIDVRLLKPTGNSGLAYWVILELKVIKSYTNPSDGSGPPNVSESANVTAIVEGVEQAGSYRENRHAEEGMLEIYDLRRDKSENLISKSGVVNAIQSYTPPPKINVWPVFGKPKDARKAGFTAN